MAVVEQKNAYTPKKWDWKHELDTNEYLSPTQARIIKRLHENTDYIPFKLDPAFVAKYGQVDPAFGFNGVGEVTYMRTYSREMPNSRSREMPKGKREGWKDTIERVVNGTFNMQKRYIQDHGMPWDDYKGKEHAEEMYDRIFHMKFLPPGRGLWAMGSEATEERGLYAALNNCAFVSTDNLEKDLAKPFTFLMDMSMVGVGVGFDTEGAGKVIIKGPDSRRTKEKFVIPDTREGWVESVRRQIESYFIGGAPLEFNYDNIRPRGELIQGFGGKSSGHGALEKLHTNLEDLFSKEVNRPISSTDIVDIENLIGVCVVAGNVRRTAEIAFGRYGDEEFLDLKNPTLHQAELDNHRWASNNSIFAELGMDYEEIQERIMKNGEPGLAWLDNMRHYGRMKDPRNNDDARVKGANPCAEQSLESYELCNLVETFPNKHENLEDYLRTMKFAYMYAKTVSLGETHFEETNRVLLRNRRIGTSMSGVAQFVDNWGISNLREWSNKAYERIQELDEKYSGDWFAIPRSIKTTSIKPSGTVSLVAGATPGMHWSVMDRYQIRRINFSKDDDLLAPIKTAGYYMEENEKDSNSMIVEFPVDVGGDVRSENEVSMWEQLEMAALLQEEWADNQVSCTIKFDPETEGPQIANALDYFQHRLKSISFLPKKGHGYVQAPYESITKGEYLDKIRELKPIDFSNANITQSAEGERFCGNDSCEIQLETQNDYVASPLEVSVLTGNGKLNGHSKLPIKEILRLYDDDTEFNSTQIGEITGTNPAIVKEILGIRN